MEQAGVNEHLESILARLDEVGRSRWSLTKSTENMNNKIEYHRLKNLFLEECLKAFRDGKRFTE